MITAAVITTHHEIALRFRLQLRYLVIRAVVTAAVITAALFFYNITSFKNAAKESPACPDNINKFILFWGKLYIYSSIYIVVVYKVLSILYIGSCQAFENLQFLRKLNDFLYFFWMGVTERGSGPWQGPNYICCVLLILSIIIAIIIRYNLSYLKRSSYLAISVF